jgi:uncharacterized protein YbjT (DUF2867 family)
VRPSSAEKPAVQALRDRNVEIRIADITKDSVETLVQTLSGIDTVIVAIAPAQNLAQIPLADAAKVAGVKRFVPSAWATACPPGEVLKIRDEVNIPFWFFPTVVH